LSESVSKIDRPLVLQHRKTTTSFSGLEHVSPRLATKFGQTFLSYGKGKIGQSFSRRRLRKKPTRYCVYQKPDPSVMPRWNRLSYPDDRVVLLRSGRLGLVIQVEVAP